MSIQEAVEVIEANALTAEQAAAETGISRMYLHQLARKNAPESEVIVLGRRFISREWLTSYVDQRAARAAAKAAKAAEEEAAVAIKKPE